MMSSAKLDVALPASLYERDMYAWAYEQARLLRAGQLVDLDIENIAEELESLGRSEKREIRSRLSVILIHLLKCQFQPERKGASWENTIHSQRVDLALVIEDNPSLRPWLPEACREAYDMAVLKAAQETKKPKSAFPPSSPWTPHQIMDLDFWP